MKKLTFIFSAACLSLAACNPHLEPSIPNQGNADFSTYVAVGNSLTAGFADGTLYRSGQEVSFPSMLAKQFAMVSNSTGFVQPLVPSDNGSFGTAKLVLGISANCTGATSLGPVSSKEPLSTPIQDAASVASQGPFNNLGVPFIRAIDYLIPGYALDNPYAARFFRKPLSRPTEELKNLKPTFFTM